MQKPGKVTAVAVLQIVSGLLQFPVSCLAATSLSVLYGFMCGLLTVWAGGIGACAAIVGYLSFLLIPIGVLEVVSGICLLAGVRSSVLVKVTSIFEILGLFLGGLPGVLVGIVNLVLVSDADVKDWLAEGKGSPIS